MGLRAPVLHDNFDSPLHHWQLPLFSLINIIGTLNCKNPRLASITLVAATLRSYANNTMRHRDVDIAILGVDIAILGVNIAILGVGRVILRL